jgi:Phage capsid-like protein
METAASNETDCHEDSAMTNIVDVPTAAPSHRALMDAAARQLANATKTTAQLSSITPRWLIRMLAWTPVEAGIYRLNRVINPESVVVACPPRDESELPTTYVGYSEAPREILLNSVSTIVDIHTRVADLYGSPHDQIEEQLRLTIEMVKERQESELINSPDYGLVASATASQRIAPLTGPPTPDDFDQLITKVWKEPAFFMTHPLGVAAFGRECTRRGVPPPTVSLFGSQFITWRGIPIIPSDKVPVTDGRTKVLLLRLGEQRQGVIGLYQPGLAGERSPGLSVRFMGINRHAIASYLVSLYCSLAVLTPDALAVLDDVEVSKFHDYAHTYR